MNSVIKNDEGFTGIEAAIIFIAFVSVAVVFAYMAIGSGAFATQKAQGTVYESVQRASSVLELSGPVSVHTSDGSSIDNITFYLQVSGKGSGVDMSKVMFTLSTPKMIKTFTNLNPVNYTWVRQNPDHDREQSAHTGQLALREMVMVTINPEVPSTELGVNTKFFCEVRPPDSTTLPISRTIPSVLVPNQWYEIN